MWTRIVWVYRTAGGWPLSRQPHLDCTWGCHDLSLRGVWDEGSKTVYETVADGAEQLELGKRVVNTRAYLSWFNFKGADQQKPVSVLSGGERNRLCLAQTLKLGGNLLLLDEPTNDVDVETLRR